MGNYFVSQKENQVRKSIKNNVNKDYFISVVSVLYNDADILRDFVNETIETLKDNFENYELVLIDNASTDSTSSIIDEILEKVECIRYIKLSKKYQLEVAISAGLDTVIGDVVITMEPQCDPPSLIPVFVEKTIKSGGVTYGIRINYDSKMPFYYGAGKAIYHALCRVLFEFSPPKDAGLYMGFSRSALNAIIQIKDRSKFLRIFGKKIGYASDNLHYRIRLRRGKIRRRAFSDTANYGLQVIFTNSNKALRLISFTGLIAAFLDLIFIVYAVLLSLITRNPIQGISLLSLQIAVLFFFIFIIIAMFVEYFIRNVENTKEGPVYYLEAEKNSNVMVWKQDEKVNIFDKEHMS